jgi:Flp pilus assembly protein TadB
MALTGIALITLGVWLFLGTRVHARIRALAPLNARASEGSADSRSVADGALALQAPVVADLLGAALISGAPLDVALRVTAEATDEPARECLSRVLSALDLGADPATAWSELLDDPSMAPLAHAIVRSHHSGAPLSQLLEAAASDVRHAHRAEVEARARSAGVRSVAPLALCYLPAYLLVGVVPVVAGFASGVLS